MIRISSAIQSGAEGFLRVQYSAIAYIAVAIAVLLGILYLFRHSNSNSIPVSSLSLSLITSVSYLIGAFCSGLAGYIGVWICVRVNLRVATAASKLNYPLALLLSFRGGAVSAILSASLCIIGLTILYVSCFILFSVFGNVQQYEIPLLLGGYGFGGALVALFMQLGGGIYTKAADVGADMCGKIK
jgi:Na+/H+-translocating membrane pyrophosphatase